VVSGSGPLIAYVRSGVGTYLAFRAGGEWFWRPLDGGQTEPPDIAVSSAGRVFVAAGNGHKVRLVELQGAQTTRTTIVDSGHDGAPRLDLWQGQPRIVYQRSGGAADGILVTQRKAA
jgi:WD40 repeat protein